MIDIIKNQPSFVAFLCIYRFLSYRRLNHYFLFSLGLSIAYLVWSDVRSSKASSQRRVEIDEGAIGVATESLDFRAYLVL